MCRVEGTQKGGQTQNVSEARENLLEWKARQEDISRSSDSWC